MNDLRNQHNQKTRDGIVYAKFCNRNVESSNDKNKLVALRKKQAQDHAFGLNCSTFLKKMHIRCRLQQQTKNSSSSSSWKQICSLKVDQDTTAQNKAEKSCKKLQYKKLLGFAFD